MSKNTSIDVCIVGGGPTGLILAINLAQSGFKVTVCEANVDISTAFRAVGHIPPVFPEFAKANVLEAAKRASKSHSGWIHFRRTTDKEIVDAIPPVPGRPGPMVFPQSKLIGILLDRVAQLGDRVEVLMGHRVTGFTDHGPGAGVTATVQRVQSDESKTYHCKYLVGADGSKSFVRRTLGLSYTGQTLPFRLVAADLFYPFESFGWDGANFMCDAMNFGNIAQVDTVDGESLWRVGIGFPVDMSDEQIRQALPARYEAMFPRSTADDGTKAPLKYRHHTEPIPYEAHHFCVPQLRAGNVLLVGDAAHIANPFSGQVLACGIFDASSLADCLDAVEHRGRPDTLLDEWSADRVRKYRTVLDPLARACFEAVSHPDVDSVGSRHPFLKAMKAMKAAGPGKGPTPPSLATDVETLNSWGKPEDGAIEKKDRTVVSTNAVKSVEEKV